MTNDTSLESSCALLLESAKKIANLQKNEFFIAKSSYIVKMFAEKICQNNDLVCYRQNQSFRQCASGLRQLVLKPGFRPRGRALGM